MAFTLNGIGTTFYGQRDFNRDGTHITTEWIVLFYIPILPIRSMRVKYRGESDGPRFGIGSCRNYAVYEKRWPDWRQVISVYGYVGFLAIWIYLICTQVAQRYPEAFGSVSGVTIIFIACSLPAPTPFLLRYLAGGYS